MAKTKEYSEGYVAGEAGARSSSNPYQHGTDDYYNWQAGWSAAQDDFLGDLQNASVGESPVLWIIFIAILVGAAYLASEIIGYIGS